MGLFSRLQLFVAKTSWPAAPTSFLSRACVEKRDIIVVKHIGLGPVLLTDIPRENSFLAKKFSYAPTGFGFHYAAKFLFKVVVDRTRSWNSSSFISPLMARAFCMNRNGK